MGTEAKSKPQTPNPKPQTRNSKNPNPTEACGNCVSSLDTRSEQLKRAASQAGKRWPRQRRRCRDDQVQKTGFKLSTTRAAETEAAAAAAVESETDAETWSWPLALATSELVYGLYENTKRPKKKKRWRRKTQATTKKHSKRRFEREFELNRRPGNSGDFAGESSARSPVNGTQAPRHHGTAAPQAPH